MALIVLAADVLTKALAVAQLSDQEPVRLLGGAVYLSLTRNTGAAFNLGAGYTAVLAVVAAVVIVVIIRFASRLGSRPWALALGLVLGGAAGNLTDRLFRAPGPFRGGVIDFISLFGPYGHPWPIFNVADSSLVVGVILAVALELSGRRLDGARARRGAEMDAGTPAAADAGVPEADAPATEDREGSATTPAGETPEQNPITGPGRAGPAPWSDGRADKRADSSTAGAS